jgi:hypothetical protein
MPQRKHSTKSRHKNAKKAREARAQGAQGELCKPLTPALIHWQHAYVENIDKINNPNDRHLQPAAEECGGGQREDEIDIEEPYEGLEIVEQSALDHFNAILQKAQGLAALAQGEKEKTRKRPRRYSGRSKKTLKQHKKQKEDLQKKGFHSMFEYIALKKDEAEKKARMEQLALGAIEIEESEESEPEELGTEDSVSERVGQVCRWKFLTH